MKKARRWRKKVVKNMNTEYLIIGNSVAGINCISGIREIDKNGSIVVVSDENVYNYSRPLISYFLGGRLGEDAISFKGEDFYKDNKVELMNGIRAEKIDVDRKEVITSRGTIEFNKLLISTGGKPVIPSIDGYAEDIEGIFTFTNLSDAKRLDGYIKRKNIKKGVILGGGLIGLKCAEGLIERGIQVSIVEMSDRLLSMTLDKDASLFIEEMLKNKKQCDVLTKETVNRIMCDGKLLSGVTLSSGKNIHTELLIIAAGVRPDITLVKDTFIKYNRGILVDEHMRTSVPFIYAAGDVAEGKDMITGNNSVIAIWPVAAKQGKVAGMNMAGSDIIYDGLFPMNAVDIVGVPVISFGITNPSETDGYEIVKERRENIYKKIVLKDNRIVGCIFLGRIERSGIFQGLIKYKIDVSRFKDELLSDDFGLLVLPAEYRKHMVRGEGIEV